MQKDPKQIRNSFFDELIKAENEIKRLQNAVEKLSQLPSTTIGVETLRTISKRVSATTELIRQ
jgi:hypothetical protein